MHLVSGVVTALGGVITPTSKSSFAVRAEEIMKMRRWHTCLGHGKCSIHFALL